MKAWTERQFCGIVLLTLAAVLLSGCIEPRGAVAHAGAEAPVGTWEATLNGSVTCTLARGDPTFRSILVAGGDCKSLRLLVPENTTLLSVTVSGEFVDASRPGAGPATVQMKHTDAREWERPPVDAPRERTTLDVRQPEPGKWIVWVWPYAVSVNQEYVVDVRATGEGAEPETPLEWMEESEWAPER